MALIKDLDQMDAEDILRRMNDLEIAPDNILTADFEIAKSAIQVKAVGSLMRSIVELRRSSESSSKALTFATYVLAGVALIQAVIFALQWLKGVS